MAHITVAAAQQWLESTKLQITSLDSELEDTASTMVLGSLSQVFPIAGTWVDTNTTPHLVQKIISMIYAAWFYRRQYSEQSETTKYADDLEGMAQDLLDGVVAGHILLTDVPVASQTPADQDPSYYPNDSTGYLVDYFVDPNNPQSQITGNRSQDDEGAKFTMGAIW